MKCRLFVEFVYHTILCATQLRTFNIPAIVLKDCFINWDSVNAFLFLNYPPLDENGFI